MRRALTSLLAVALIAVQCAAMCQCRLDHVAHQAACEHEGMPSDVALHADDAVDGCGDHDVVKRPNPLPSSLPLAFDEPCITVAAALPIHRPPATPPPLDVAQTTRILPLLI